MDNCNRCCTKCYYCKAPTNILNYYHRFGHIICSKCINYIQACRLCNKWYTKGLIKINIHLYCVTCLNDTFENDLIKKCIQCKEPTRNVILKEKVPYCTNCITNINMVYNFKN